MYAFSRLSNLFTFLLSLSIIAFALPTPLASTSSYSEERTELVAPTSNPNNVFDLLANLEAQIKGPITLIAEAKSYSEVRAHVDVVVARVEACNDAVLAAGKRGEIDESMKVEIASKAASIISVIVQACLEVSLKLGWFLLFGIFAKIDVCLKSLITNLGTCGEGIVMLITKTTIFSPPGKKKYPKCKVLFKQTLASGIRLAIGTPTLKIRLSAYNQSSSAENLPHNSARNPRSQE
ncbi:hypothetical protein B0J17DRAFT_631921 [Rhizoctonia solani]|nr:hypothetical protein B0J17DRAFT_631921 [Rhizoctonia solani]